MCGARSHRANQSPQDARAPRHGASTNRGTEPRRNRPQSAPDAARLDHAPPILRRPGTASTSTDQPPPRSSPHRPTRPPRRPTATRAPTPPSGILLGHFSVVAVFSANPKTRYDARTSYSQKFQRRFFQRSRKVAMMRTRTTPKSFRPVFSAGREFRYDARASYSESFSSGSGNPS